MSSPTNLPTVAVTMGDPGGVGPEITLKALVDPGVLGYCRSLVIGSSSILAETARDLGIHVELTPWAAVGQQSCPAEPGIIPIVEAGAGHPRPPLGRPSATGGSMALAAITTAANLALSGAIDAMATAPVAKESLSLAGCTSKGHTDLLAQLSGVTDYAMMLSTKGIHVVHATTHLPLVEACRELSPELILARIRLAAKTARRLDLVNPTVAVCGLNPHAGENGLIGGEERAVICPAIERARSEGIKVSGPFAPDTIFGRAVRGDFNMILAMYHDQGHMPIKLLGFMEAVNVTLGLPFVRTSVAHGTAFARAGKGTADPGSLRAALRMAALLCARRS